MKITMITAVRNSADTIERTIRSVLNQNYPELEYWIIDGCSTDGTLEIVKKYSDQIKYISEKDSGISDAFNKGISKATGDIIGIINADDMVAPGTFNTIASIYSEDIDIIYGNGIRVYKDGTQKPYNSADNPNSLYIGMSMCHPAVYVSKKAYSKYGGFSIDYKCVMDRELLLRMLHGGAKFLYVNKVFGYYTMGGMSENNYYKYTLPEDYRISVNYGMSPVAAGMHIVSQVFLYWGSKCKQRLLKIV